MIERIIELSIRHRGLTIAAGLLLGLWGLYAAIRTPIDAIPDLSETQVIVFTDWPGRSPQEVETQVTLPLSLQLQGLDDVRAVRTSSDFGFSMIHVIFDDAVKIDAARRSVAERLATASVELPSEVRPALAPDAPATGQIFWYTVEGAGYDLGRLRAIHDGQIQGALASVPGVAEVASVGGYATECHVVVDPQRLAARGLSLEVILKEIADANVSLDGQVMQSPTAEHLVHVEGRLGQGVEKDADQAERMIRDLERIILPLPSGGAARLGELAQVTLAPGFRRGVLEKDGSEAVGGVVMMRYGENPLEVTRRLQEKIGQLRTALPSGVRIVPGYDRTPLIQGAVRTVTGTVLEAMLTAVVCVLLVLLHLRASLVIAISLPLAVLGAFAAMWLTRTLGLADVQTNIMSLAGLAISIGVLVDSSIVITENAMHALRQRFGDEPARGDLRQIVADSCRLVGRPIFFSVLIMLLSFLPVFALGGIEGKMFFPLACAKSFAMAMAAALSITFVPALCTVLLRGRIHAERESWLVRGVMDVYRPVLSWLLDRPRAVLWIMAVTFLVGFAASPWRPLFLGSLAAGAMAIILTARQERTRWLSMLALVGVALAVEQIITPLQTEFVAPLDEGVAMDMPITIPRASVRQSADDLKARDMMLCRFPEVEMVMGKAGRAETAADPAPIDMIETMIGFRPREQWPRRKLREADARRQAAEIWRGLVERGLVEPAASDSAEAKLIDDSLAHILPHFDALIREFAYHRNREQMRMLGPLLVKQIAERAAEILEARGDGNVSLVSGDLDALAARMPFELARRLASTPIESDAAEIVDEVAAELHRRAITTDSGAGTPDVTPLAEQMRNRLRSLGGLPPVTPASQAHAAAQRLWRKSWQEHLRVLDDELVERAAGVFTRLALEDLLLRGESRDAELAAKVQRLQELRLSPPKAKGKATHHGGGDSMPDVDPLPALDTLQAEFAEKLAGRMILWRNDRAELAGFGGEMDRALQMPGWTNVWTMPIQNRVDMLATGVNTTVGIRVLGRDQAEVVQASEQIAEKISQMPGAAQVVADPIRGKAYLSVRLDRERAALLGVRTKDAGEVLQAALGGMPAATVALGRERRVVRVRYPAMYRDDPEALRRLPVPTFLNHGQTSDAAQSRDPLERLSRHASLGDVATIGFTEGPASIKGENGLLRNYVRLNVEGRDPMEFVAEAQRRLAAEVDLPQGVRLEWTGQYEHQQRARRTLALVTPLVVLLILALLYATFRDFADAALVLLAVPGALAGGMFVQWCFGFKLSVTVVVGYIACFGMATATGVIMLVYLRDALARAGGLEQITLPQLREAVMAGAVHRLRPKLLTEATTIIGLAPMLWADGVGAEVIRPMAAPVLGGILVADEVIDLFLPVMFHWVRRRRWHALHRGQGEVAARDYEVAHT